MKKLVARFDAARYGALLDTMDAHDVGRDRGGISAALGAVADRLTGVGIPGDLLYPAESVREWTQAANARYVDLQSIHGHDAFLLETRQVNAILRDAIDRAMPAPDVIARLSSTASREIRVRDVVVPRDAACRATSTDRVAPSVRIALAGSGHVGGGLLDLLALRNAAPNAVRVKRVLVSDATRSRPALARAIANGLVKANACVRDASTLLDDTTDVLVEAIGGTTTARTNTE